MVSSYIWPESLRRKCFPKGFRMSLRLKTVNRAYDQERNGIHQQASSAADPTREWLFSRQPLEIPFQTAWLINPGCFRTCLTNMLPVNSSSPKRTILQIRTWASRAMMKWQTRSHYESNGENKASKDHDKSRIRCIQTRRTAHYHNVNEASKR